MSSGASRSLGATPNVRVGRPSHSGSSSGPIGSGTASPQTDQNPLYGLSQVFVVAGGTSSDATLSALTVNDGTTDHTIDLADG